MSEFTLREGEKIALQAIQDKIFQQNKFMGWHDKPREEGTMIALCHSELSEALEGVRKDKMDDHLTHRKQFEVELADCMIRILDMGGKYGLDLASAMAEKIEYNRARADHQKENRVLSDGKKF